MCCQFFNAAFPNRNRQAYQIIIAASHCIQMLKQKCAVNACAPLDKYLCCFSVPVEISVEQSCKRFAVSRFIFCHFMNSVMYGPEVQFLGFCRQCFLPGASAVFSIHPHTQILFSRIRDYFTEQFRKL